MPLRSQLYIVTIIVISVLFYLTFTYFESIKSEIKNSLENFEKISLIYKIKNFDKIVKPYIELNDSIIIPFIVIYDCSYNVVKIKVEREKINTIFSLFGYYRNVSVYSRNLTKIKINYIGDSVIMKLKRGTGTCIFEGYLVFTNKSVGYDPSLIGSEPLSYTIYYFFARKFRLEDLYIINILQKDFEIRFKKNYTIYTSERLYVVK